MGKEELVTKLGNTNIYVKQGDITKIPTNAIMTAINSGGLWFGGVDTAIMKVAGNTYHSQVANAGHLSNLQTIIAKGNKKKHNGTFDDVVFVIDDLKSPLSKVIYSGLKAANKEIYNKLLIPAIRTGVTAGKIEKDKEEVANGYYEGIMDFMKKQNYNAKIKNIGFTIYNDYQLVGLLTKKFKKCKG